MVEPDTIQTHVKIQKQNSKFMSRQYTVPKHQLMKLPRAAAMKARKRIAELAPICHLELNRPKVSLHVFTPTETDTEDEEDLIFYTIRTDNDRGECVWV